MRGIVNAIRLIGLIGLICFLNGCEQTRPTPRVIPCPPPAKEIPVANLPLLLREWNWLSKNQEGSCGYASSVYHLRWHGKFELADWFRKNHAGGVTATSIKRDWAAAGIPFHHTEDGDPAFLQWATRNRHGAIIWFFESHCVHFCGIATIDGKTYGILCDNNRVEKYLRVPYVEFVQRWREYGGFACATTWSPPPPIPWAAYQAVD